MQYIFCLLIGYMIGTLNPSYMLAKLHGFDIRARGSGNAGASNALMLLGKTRGIVCALFDIIKAAFAIWLCEMLFPTRTYAYAVTAVSCVLGHIFPFYMHFRGGKGLACLAGSILIFDWRVFLIMLAGAIVVALMTNYICFVPMTASVIFPVIYGMIRKDVLGALILCILIPIILYKHRENIRRIRAGKEMRLSFLWNKDKELERLQIPKD